MKKEEESFHCTYMLSDDMTSGQALMPKTLFACVALDGVNTGIAYIAYVEHETIASTVPCSRICLR